MKCPHCGGVRSRVENTIPAPDLQLITRWRRCYACNSRFRTFEGQMDRDVADEIRRMDHWRFLRLVHEIRERAARARCSTRMRDIARAASREVARP